MRPFDLTVDRKLSYLLEVNGKIRVFTQKKYIYWIQKNTYNKWEGEQLLSFFHFIVTKENILSIKLDFVLQYGSVQYPFVLSSIDVEYLVEQFPYQLHIDSFGFTSGHYTSVSQLCRLLSTVTTFTVFFTFLCLPNSNRNLKKYLAVLDNLLSSFCLSFS